MIEAQIMDLLLSSLETDDDPTHLIENQLKCLAGLQAESPLDLSA